jgi:16S rRNA (uracil1498-N3)-methyltransferase
VVERAGVAVSLPTFVADEPLAAHATLTLGEDAAHHMRVRRLETGVRIALVDGSGHRGEGVVTQLAKRHALVAVEEVEQVAAPAPIHLLVPVADRDRMLWLAEKVTELAVASWRPVLYKRSKHVSPRGEGTTFQQKVRARMSSALAQSQGAWRPLAFPEASLEHAIAARPEGFGVVLDQGGRPLLEVLAAAPGGGAAGTRPGTVASTHGVEPVTLAVGPEGGFEPAEFAALEAAGFARAGLGGAILRFETAAVAAVAVARAHLDRVGAAAPPGDPRPGVR